MTPADCASGRKAPVRPSHPRSCRSLQAHGPGTPTLLARTTDGQPMVLVRSSEISLWQATHPDRVRPVVAPPQAPGEELPPFPGPPPPPPPHAGATATIAPGSRFEGRGRPGNLKPNVAFRGDPIAVQLAPRGDRIYMLGGFNRLIIWALDPGDAERADQGAPARVRGRFARRVNQAGIAARRFAAGDWRPHRRRDLA